MDTCRLAVAILLTAPVLAAEVDTKLTDAEFYAALNLDLPALAAVKQAVERGEFAKAQTALADTYRHRSGATWYQPAKPTDQQVAELRAWGDKLLRHELFQGSWLGDFELDWVKDPDQDNKGRQYFVSSLADAYRATKDPALARMWSGLMRSFIAQIPPDGATVHQSAMVVGIRLRDPWPNAFHTFLAAPEFSDRDVLLALKSMLEQARSIVKNRRVTGNQLTFAMVGLYSAGVALPELREAEAWRDLALDTAVADLERGYLPDGMGVELSPGYHAFFYNYLRMIRLARHTQRGADPRLHTLAGQCDRLFEVYLKLATPDREVPAFQDGQSTSARRRLTEALETYPERQDFRWLATDGAEGTPPDYTSLALPYAGYLVMRSSWGKDANYLCFDVGPIGWKHCHADKLNLVVWGYGRRLLFDPGRHEYSREPLSVWAADTFAHNTALVDNRPQRRKWSTPDPSQMPYQPLRDYRFETTAAYDRAAGLYDGAYGLPGPSDSYPYEADSNYLEGWGKPARHHRRVFFLKPDLVLVADTLFSLDGAEHDYEVRWQVDSTTCQSWPDGGVATRDEGLPNLLLRPLTGEAQVDFASAQMAPDILGWSCLDGQVRPATTVRHRLRARDGHFLTLLLPLKPGQAPPMVDYRAGTLRVGERSYTVTVPADPATDLMVTAIE